MKLFLALVMLFCLSSAMYIYADIARQPASVITTVIPAPVSEERETVTIVRTERGYVPREVFITVGTTVIFVNESRAFHWPASDYHPTHSEYPGPFDPGRPLAVGDTWEFTFTNIGEWGYHDHLRANYTGMIVVEDPEAGSFVPQDGQIIEQIEG